MKAGGRSSSLDVRDRLEDLEMMPPELGPEHHVGFDRRTAGHRAGYFRDHDGLVIRELEAGAGPIAHAVERRAVFGSFARKRMSNGPDILPLLSQASRPCGFRNGTLQCAGYFNGEQAGRGVIFRGRESIGGGANGAEHDGNPGISDAGYSRRCGAPEDGGRRHLRHRREALQAPAVRRSR